MVTFGGIIIKIYQKFKYYGKILNQHRRLLILIACFSIQSRRNALALLEALSLGKAYICSNIDPHMEVYKSDNGRSGFIYELENKEELINPLINIIILQTCAMLSSKRQTML